jgi:S1-C subfamily serine protease
LIQTSRRSRCRPGFGIFGSLVLTFATSFPAAALDTKAIFDRYSDSIVQLRIVEAGSGAKRTIGTAFVIGENGELATNYHVISDLVIEPDLYRAEWVDSEGEGHPVALLGFDVVRDLAIVRAESPFGRPFALHTGTPSKGERIYAIGDPYDLGMTIVEGLYNGRLEHSRYERIHFTGSLNPGMSGGPALLPNGEVIGVNVASSGNQVSFLVPAPDLHRLAGNVLASDYSQPEDWTQALRSSSIGSRTSPARPGGSWPSAPGSAPGRSSIDCCVTAPASSHTRRSPSWPRRLRRRSSGASSGCTSSSKRSSRSRSHRSRSRP